MRPEAAGEAASQRIVAEGMLAAAAAGTVAHLGLDGRQVVVAGR